MSNKHEGQVKVLAVFNLIPEETLMAINWVDQEVFDQMKLAHNKTMNGDDFTPEEAHGFEIINNAFIEKGQQCTPGYEQFAGLFGKDHAVEGNDIADVTHFITASFYL